MSQTGGSPLGLARVLRDLAIPYLQIPRPLHLAAIRVKDDKFFDAKNSPSYPQPRGPEQGDEGLPACASAGVPTGEVIQFPRR